MRKKCFLKTKLSTRWSVTEGILTLLQHLNHRVENDLVISLSITVLWTCWLIVRVKEVLKRDCCRCGIRCFESVKEGHHRSPYCQNDKSYHCKGEPWSQIFSRPARPESVSKHFCHIFPLVHLPKIWIHRAGRFSWSCSRHRLRPSNGDVYIVFLHGAALRVMWR